MKKLVRKDLNKRQKLMLIEKQKFVLKNMIKNHNFNKKLKKKISFKSNFNNTLFTQINNRCIITNRKKKINKLFRFSRLCFLRYIRAGYIFGFRKSSW